ncbi:MAG: hypothetical protein WB540_03065, partial [Pseudolabrys sp.]
NMDAADKFSKMAAELYEKAGAEESSDTKSELEMAAQIYVVLAQREDKAAVADSDAKGLQQQIAKHFADGTF